MPTIRLTDNQLLELMAELERERGTSASQFYDEYREGRLGDSPDVLRWAGLCYMAMRAGLLDRAALTR